MGDIQVVCAEMLLAKYFSEHGREQPAGACMEWVKRNMQGSGVRRAEIKEARKNLRIRSWETGAGYLWSWENETGPEEMWAIKSREFLGC